MNQIQTASTSRAVTPLALAVLLASLGTSSANVALPVLADAFGASFSAVQWVVLAYLLAMTMVLVTAGRLGDLVGHKRLFAAGVTCFAMATTSCAAAPSLAVLAIARAFQGMAAACLTTMAFTLATQNVLPARRGRAMGLLATMSSLGTMAGPVLGSCALAWSGWRALFLLPLPVAAVIVAMLWRLPAAPPSGSRGVLDWPGAILLAAGLAAYAAALTPGRAAVAGSATAVLLAVAVACVTGFAWRQARAPSPLIVTNLFRHPVIVRGLASTMLVTTVMMATLVTGPFFLTLGLAVPVSQLGLLLAAGPVAAVLAGLPAGRLADRFGARRIAVAGLGLAVIGTAWLSRTGLGQGIPGFIAPIMILSVGYAGFLSANTAMVMGQAGPAERGAVSGVLNLARNLGLLTGASLMATLFTVGTGPAKASQAAVEAGMHACFGVGVLLTVSALVAAMLPIRSRPQE